MQDGLASPLPGGTNTALPLAHIFLGGTLTCKPSSAALIPHLAECRGLASNRQSCRQQSAPAHQQTDHPDRHICGAHIWCSGPVSDAAPPPTEAWQAPAAAGMRHGPWRSQRKTGTHTEAITNAVERIKPSLEIPDLWQAMHIKERHSLINVKTLCQFLALYALYHIYGVSNTHETQKKIPPA